MRFTTIFGTLLCAAAASGAAVDNKHAGQFDYVIVGGGLTGLVTAARLSEDPDVSVLVLEYGFVDRSNVTKIPYYATSLNTANLRDISSAPEPQLNDRVYAVRAAQVAGGGSQVNGMTWDLPSGAEFDAFAALGNPGWDWEGLQPYYKKAAQLAAPDPEIEARYNYSYDLSAYGGKQSLAKVGFPEFQYPDMYNFKDGFAELGVPFVEEHALGNAVGHFWAPSSLNSKRQTRASSLYSYYDRVSKRENLDFRPMHQVTKVTFNKNLAATGVKAINREEEREVSFKANKEVILAAGAIFTPQILQLSGIGPKGVLDAAGVETKLDFPAVGSNFQDHPTAFLSWNISASFPNPSTLATNATFFEEARRLYFDERTGPLTKAQSSYIGFMSIQSMTPRSTALLNQAQRTSPSDFLPEIYAADPQLVAGFKAQRDILLTDMRAGTVAVLEVPISGGGLVPNAMQKPLSRGTVHLNATAPAGVPVVLHNSLAHPFDRAALFEALQFTRRLFATAAVAPLDPVEVTPGPAYTAPDETIARLIDSGALTPTFSHPSCSCPMMPRELGGVVDAELRVYGTRRLSVVDASILPVIPAAHLQATMYTVAEKAADIIKARA